MDALLKQLVNRSPLGIVVVDTDRRLQIINPAAYALITIVGQPIGQILDEAIPILEFKTLCPENDDGVPLELELVYGRKELKIRSTSLSSGQNNDEMEGRLLLIEDITHAKRVERTQREFVANVSHELRTPATSIHGFAKMLLDDKEMLNSDHQMMVEAIHRNANRLHTLFEDLLTLSKIEADNSPLPNESLSLLGLVQECVDKQSVRAEEKNISFHVMVSERLFIHSNRDALIHIVGNLVENAVKYSLDNSMVTVRAALRENTVQLEVIDLGLGIAPSHQKRIFERFFRVDKGRSRKVGGTGLGLAIVRTLLERTGIRMELRSQVDKGSIFRIYLSPCNTMMR